MPRDTIYDHPLYYDILFSWDRAPEARFYDAVFRHCGIDPSERICEVACGTGRIARLLAARGWAVTAFDLREPMLAFLRDAARREGLRVDATCADMRRFRSDRPLGGALSPLSSFRLLQRDGDAVAHLSAMSACIRPGGVYVLDVAFTDDDEPAVTTDEDWSMQRGAVTVTATNDAVLVDDGGASRTLDWGDEVHLRDLPAADFERWTRRAGFRIESLHPEVGRNEDGVSLWDVSHRLDGPSTGRAMVVLRRT